MAFPKFQTKEVLNKVLNSAETALQVDIVSGAEYAEDSAHTSEDTGNFILGVRNDTLAALGGADGDYVPFQMNASGALYVEISSGGSSDAVHVDDAAFTLGSHKGMMMMGFAGTQSVDANDAGAIAMETDGSVHIHDGGNTITVDGTVTANLSATDNAVLDAMVVDLAAMETLLTAANVDHAANEVLLTGIDADTNAIKVDMAAIEVLLTAANVDHAANEVLLTGIDADTDAIKTDMAAIEVLLTGIDADTDAIKTDAAAIEVLLTAANVDHAANEALLTTIDADTGAIETAVELIDDAVATLGTTTYSETSTKGLTVGVVRNDTLAALAGTDNEVAPLQVDKTGALYTVEETGQLGAIFEDGTTAVSSKQVVAIQFLEDTTFTTLTPADSSFIGTASGNGDNIDTSNTFPQGMTIFGRWTAFTLASGSIVAYQGAW